MQSEAALDGREVESALKNNEQLPPGIVIDFHSLSVVKLHNMTAAETLFKLTQFGFFKNGIENFDVQLLEKVGLVSAPVNIGKIEVIFMFCV